jgi:TP901 family phage tail tape measure protein
MLVLRAKDEASRVIQGVGGHLGRLGTDARMAAGNMIAAGSMLATVGAGMTGAGIALGNTLWEFTEAASEYRQQAALAATQAEGMQVSVEELEKVGMRVAAVIPVPFEQVQQGLYDIFSAMDVGAKDAEKILEGLARAAVAGQTDITTAGQGTIAILNAYGLTAEDIDRVMDVQFQMVRRGVGTYAEFAQSIGLAIPASVRAGQEIETLAGMMSFLTRNGLSTSSAAAAAGRALETLAHPTVTSRLEKMGVAVKNQAGEFLPLVYIVQQMKDQLGDLTAPQRAEALQNLFKGAGNSIQARRFWDTALSNTDAFLENVDAMGNAAGSLDQAYDIMFNQPQTQMQLLKNNWDILKVSFGQALLPILVEGTKWGLKFVGWLQDLSPHTKDMIAKGLALGAAFLTVVGALTGLAGGALMIAGFIKYMGGFISIIGILVRFAGVIGLIATAAFLIYKNWDTIGPWFKALWDTMLAKVQEFKAWFDQNWPAIWAKVQEVAAAVWNWLVETWTELWPKIRAAAEATWDWIQAAWPKVVEAFNEGVDGAKEIWSFLVENIPKAWKQLKRFGNYMLDEFAPGAVKVWESIKQHAVPIIEGLITIFGKIVDAVRATSDGIQKHWNTIWSYLQPVLSSMIAVVRLLWDTFANVFELIMSTVRGTVDIIAGILTGDWGRAWDGAKQILQGFWDFFKGMLEALGTFFSTVFGDFLSLVGTFFTDLWGLFTDAAKEAAEMGGNLIQGLWDGMVDIFKTALEWIMSIPEIITSGLKSLFGISSPSTVMAEIGRDVIRGFWEGAKEIFFAVLAWFMGLPAQILSGLGYLGELLFDTGKAVLQGLKDGVIWVWDHVLSPWLSGAANLFLNTIPALGQTLFEKGAALLRGLKDGVLWLWENVLVGWLGGMAWRALNAVPDMGETLYDVGMQIIDGLWDGMKDKWDDVTGWLSNLDPRGWFGGGGGGTAPAPDWLVPEIPPNAKKALTTASSMERYMTSPDNYAQSSSYQAYGGGGGGTVTVAPGAVVVHVGNVRDEADHRRIEQMVNEAFERLAQRVSQPRYGGG